MLSGKCRFNFKLTPLSCLLVLILLLTFPIWIGPGLIIGVVLLIVWCLLSVVRSVIYGLMAVGRWIVKKMKGK